MPSKDLLARYLQAVGFWLPRAAKDDILAEISEDLHSQIDDRAAALDRPLDDNDIAEILKQRGRPFAVAGTFLPQRQLIGPVLFPIYLLVLKIVGFCYLLPWLLTWVGLMTFDRAYLVSHRGDELHALGPFWTLLWTLFGIITFIFAVLDRTSNRTRLVTDWDPRKLPRNTNKQHNRKRRDIPTIIFGGLYLVWLLAVPYFPFLVMGPAAYFVRFAPVWHRLYPWLMGLAAAGVLEAAVSLLRGLPAWEAPAFRIANNGICLWLLSILWNTQTYFLAQAPQFQQDAAIANLVARIAVAGTTLGMIIALAVELWRLIQALAEPPHSTATRIA